MRTYPDVCGRMLLVASLQGASDEAARLRATLGSSSSSAVPAAQLPAKARRQLSLARLLAVHAGYGPAVVEHALLRARWLPHLPADIPQAVLMSSLNI
jgi:predicted hotdog family 3-hydroxylacyl-ACP dehydratase